MAAGGLRQRLESLRASLGAVLRAFRDEDQQLLDRLLLLSRRRRLYAPLAFTLGAFSMLLQAIRLLLADWRLVIVQVLPAMWIWLAMFDLRAHVLHGQSFKQIEGAVLVPIWIAIVAITIGCFYLNAVFAYAIVGQQPPSIRDAFRSARERLVPVAVSGGIVGLMLAFATTVVPRWHRPWFALLLGIVVGLMMIAYVAVPARLIGVRKEGSPKDKLVASAISSAVGATVSAPPYILGRVGILMLGSKVLLVPGVVLIAVGLFLQVGTTGAVRAVKMGAALAIAAGVEHDGAPGADGTGAGPLPPPAPAGGEHVSR